MRSNLDQAILQTLAYYRALGCMPFTLVEIRRYLMYDRRAVASVALFDIRMSTKNLERFGLLVQKNGFYALKNDQKRLEECTTTRKQALLKWKKLRRLARILPFIPYVRMVAVTGSLATNSARAESDIDILIKTKANRIWTTRFFVTFITHIMRRRRWGTTVANRLCFNQYITEEAQKFGPPNINDIVRAIHIPVWDENTSYQTLNTSSLLALNPNRAIILVRRLLETALSITFLGRIIEWTLAHLQIKKIVLNPVGYPKDLPRPALHSKNIIFYYPRVHETERKYSSILAAVHK